jgi:dihydroorotate dehydrogenase electron transfer subunit
MQAQLGRASLAHKTFSNPDTVHMVLDAPWLSHARPGQFVMLRIQPDTVPLLRRPISLCDITPNGIEILFKIRGTGTELMAAWPVGHQVDIIGPLGNGFSPPSSQTSACLIAGGIGIAPLIGLARWLLAERPNCDIHLLLGTKTAAESDAFVPFIPEGCTLHIATEDGTRGEHGFVTDMLAAASYSKPAAMIYGCGPMPMLEALADLTSRTGQTCQISLEAHMACGIGACLGCTVPSHTSANSTNVRVCADGPVFEAHRIFPPV